MMMRMMRITMTPHGRFDGFFSGKKTGVFLAVFSLAGILSFLILSGGHRTFRAERFVLAIPGSDASLSSGEIARNAVFLAGTDGFRTAFFSDMEAVPGFMAANEPSELSGDARREAFDGMFSFSLSGTDGVFFVRASADDPDDAAVLSGHASLSLFRYVSRYYDIRRQADFRIVDGPSVSVTTTGAFGLALAGCVIGFLVALAAVLLMNGAERMRRIRFGDVRATLPFDADMFRPKRPVSTILSDSETEGDDREEFVGEEILDDVSAPMAATPSVKQAPAPADIPVFSEEEARFLEEFSFEEGPSPEADVAEEEAASDPVTETAVDPEASVHPSATDEEYRRRLNELLRG